MIAQFIMLNMFILILLQEFEYYYVNPDNPMKHFKDDVEKFKIAWKVHGIKLEGTKIRADMLAPFFTSFKEPLGILYYIIESYQLVIQGL